MVAAQGFRPGEPFERQRYRPRITRGVSLGIAVMGSIGTAVYHATMPSGLSAQAADSLSGAMNEATALPADAAQALVAAAREAFTSGLNVAAVVAAVLVAGAGLLASRAGGDHTVGTSPPSSTRSAPLMLGT